MIYMSISPMYLDQKVLNVIKTLNSLLQACAVANKHAR